ncbi:sigma-54-dependent transcriptional regulator [candidate division KSB1 bacterium]
MKHSIMIVDDEPNVRSSLKLILEDKYNIIEAESGNEALNLLDKVNVDLILLDIRMEGMDGIQTLKEVKKAEPDVNVIMVTVEQDIKKVVDTIRLGAYDYITKPFNEDELLLSIERALENKELKHRNVYLESELKSKWRSQEIVGQSKAMINIFETIDKVSEYDTNVLITGETGVGKELVARDLHQKSLRSDKPFIAINCGAMPVNLIESELFGHEPGAYTSAITRKKGKFEVAHGGIVFLDEISELSTQAQVKLLRVLQSGEFSRLGGNQTIITDVKVFAATNQELDKMVSMNEFRKDLYYRIKVVEIKVPPLRQRREDIPLLIRHFIKKYSEEMKIKQKTISREVITKLQNMYEWEGNVRELENQVKSALILSEKTFLDLSDFFPSKSEKMDFSDLTPYFINQVYSIGLTKPEFEELRGKIKTDILKAFDKIYIERILEKVGGNIPNAIEETGMNRTFFYYLLKRANIKIEDFKDQS